MAGSSIAAALCVLVVSLTADAQLIDAVRVVEGFTQPLYVCSPPGDTDRLFVVEQTGQIWIVDLATGQTLAEPFLDIRDRVKTGGERGLLGLAFDPDYATNGYFYVNYVGLPATTSEPGDTNIARFNVSADPNVAEATSEQTLMVIEQIQARHNGGCLQFGPDGMLYVGMGDSNVFTSQNPLTLLGKMLRLDTHNPPTYVAAGNPFIGDTGTLDQIWASGLRNPWRFSFDSATGDLYIADVGETALEEINVQPTSSTGGENYGWHCMEGTQCTHYSQCPCPMPGTIAPIFEYPHDGLTGGFNCYSITGGYVYRGQDIAGLGGTYFFADYCRNRVWSFRYVDGSITEYADRTDELATIEGPIAQIVSFGQDASNELYIVSHEGGIYRIVPRQCPCDIQPDLTVDFFDLLDFLDVWFAMDAAADFNSNETVDFFDLLDFLDCWFALTGGGPCPAGL